MPTAEKKQVVEQFEKKVREAKAVVVTSFVGMKTVEFNELRAKLRPLQSDYSVVKNSLTRLALKNAGLEELANVLEGPSAIVIERGDPVSSTKVLFDFAKTHEAIKIKGGVFDGKVVTDKQLKAIASLPSREVLLATLLGSLQATAINLVSVLQAPMRDLVNVLDAHAKKLAQK